MDGETADRESGNLVDVRPSRHDRCAECGDVVADAWVRYAQKPDDPQGLVSHFGGIIKAGPAEPKLKKPKPTVRDFRYSEDLGVFFHSWCAPRVKLPEKIQEEITELLAEGLFAAYEKALERWAEVGQVIASEVTPPRCQANVASAGGRRVFTTTRSEWERLRAHEGKLVEVDLERVPSGSLGESASVIAGLAAECSVHVERIEVWRYNAEDRPARPIWTFSSSWASQASLGQWGCQVKQEEADRRHRARAYLSPAQPGTLHRAATHRTWFSCRARL